MLSIILTSMALEVALRSLGFRPYTPYKKLNVTSGGTTFKKHDRLGYTHLPGQFYVSWPDGYTVKTTHLPNSNRITKNDRENESKDKDNLWIFGCSYTYGYSLNDEETFPWLIQQQLNNYDVQNFGVTGYGTLQSLLQFKLATESEKTPKVVVLSYAPFHDSRNTFSRSWRKALSSRKYLGERSFPFVRNTNSGITNVSYGKVEYSGLSMLGKSSLMNYIDDRTNILQERFALDSNTVSLKLIEEFNAIAKQKNIKFVLAIISTEKLNTKMIDKIKSEGISVIDISVDLSANGNRNDPHDWHPSYKANKQYAAKLIAGLMDLKIIESQN